MSASLPRISDARPVNKDRDLGVLRLHGGRLRLGVTAPAADRLIRGSLAIRFSVVLRQAKATRVTPPPTRTT
jgi:hypothetical protein